MGPRNVCGGLPQEFRDLNRALSGQIFDWLD